MRFARSISLAVVALLLSATAASVSAQGTADEEKNGVPKELPTKDGWSVPITYWQSKMGKNAPVIVLLHDKNQNRLVWQAAGLADQLRREQFAVITVDLRKHGESKIPEGLPAAQKSTKLSRFDYEAMIAEDLEAVKRFIYDEHQAERLNMRKMAIIASGMGTVIGMNYAALDWAKLPYDDAPTLAARTPRGQDVQALILLSPEESLQGVGTTKTLPFLRQTGIAGLIVFGTKVSGDSRAASQIYRQLGGEQQDADNQRLYSQGYDIKLSGTQLLGRNIGTETLISAFLQKHLKDVEIEWADRKSRLQ